MEAVLSEVIFVYNTSVHSTTGITPYLLMFGVEALVPSEILIGLPEMERTPAPYAFKRYQKSGVPYEAAGERAYTAAKRAKNICVNNLQTQHQELWSSTNVVFHKCGITQMWISTNVDFHKCGFPQMWTNAVVKFHKSQFAQIWHNEDVQFHICQSSETG